ncbi:MAG: hypothetical protein KC636_26905 [Myxococcales bacterium]|nr:hypothetical protein [Myxococcales bacterium]
MTRFVTRRCTAPECGLRFPIAARETMLGERCPRCSAPTQVVDDGYETHGVRTRGGDDGARGPELEVLLDNIRSVHNVGAIVRAADGAGVRHIHLGGFTPTLDHPRMAKTSLGAELRVPWTSHRDGLMAAMSLRERGLSLWALEGGPRSRSLFSVIADADPRRPIALACGHEVSGVDPRIVELCDEVVRIPMAGVKESLNVAVAFGVAVYVVRHALRPPA